MGKLRADLQRDGFHLIETHISWVFVGADEVFKVKRPVDFGFLDFTSKEAREKACHAEVELNRRLASDVYLGVVPVTVDGSGNHAFGGAGNVVDYAVHMRKLDEAGRADRRLTEDRLTHEDIDALAHRVAEFHQEARCDEETTQHGAPSVIRRNVEENFDQTRDSIGEFLTDGEARSVETWQLEFLQHEDRFEARQRSKAVRDGHGDLRLEHVYFRDSSISIIDCIEFNDRFRYGDVCADIAFLSMDLAWHGRVDLAERFLAAYVRETQDFALYSVVDFYESYRAFVRGKIASFLAFDPQASNAARDRARSEARRYFMLSLAFERPPLVPPQVVAVGGMIACGKSRNASIIGELLSAPVVSSDRLRKHILGARPEESLESAPWSGAYSAETTERVYEAVWSAAETVVSSGRPVVLDASFRTRAMRGRARQLAESLGVPFTFVECLAPREVIHERLAKREADGGLHESDARTNLLDEFERRYEPATELPEKLTMKLDTSQPKSVTLEALRARFAVSSRATPGPR
jgi:aminoglycoside phosphotransferase family enzyme/predicted kinase